MKPDCFVPNRLLSQETKTSGSREFPEHHPANPQVTNKLFGSIVLDRSIHLSDGDSQVYYWRGFAKKNNGNNSGAQEDYEAAEYYGLLTVRFNGLASDAGISVIIAPSLPASDRVNYSGEEPGIAITGDENIPFTLVLTSGFGSFEMNQECAEINSSYRSRRTILPDEVTDSLLLATAK